MTRTRLTLILAIHVTVVVALLGWAVLETRRQQAEVERLLLADAAMLAGSLGPGLAAASDAVRELDDIVTWKLLDNARLLAEVEASPTLDSARLERIVEANGLDTVAFLGPRGTVRLLFGDPPAPELLRETDDVLSGRADEVVLGSASATGSGHLGVAVATPSGGAVLVTIRPMSARAFVQRLGVANLLEHVIGAGTVLYLSYREEPGPTLAEASWDDGPIPEPSTAAEKLRPVRGRLAFEAEVPVDAPAGARASLRVGLDGAPLAQSAAAGFRRTLLVGVVLAGYALATVGFALVSRQRGLERVESARRLAEAEAARRRSERLAAAGTLTAGLAHEVRNPLNAIGLAAQRLEHKHHEPDESRAFAQRIRQEVKRLEGVLRQFLDLARPVGESREPVDLGTLSDEVVELIRPVADSHGVRLESFPVEMIVPADREAVRRAVINLVQNAIDASPEGGRVRTVVDRDERYGRLRVVDDGPGIEPELQERAFEAFMTTRADGTGLGLSLVKRVAEEHGGRCSLVNGSEGGAEACLCLPLEEESSS